MKKDSGKYLVFELLSEHIFRYSGFSLMVLIDSLPSSSVETRSNFYGVPL